MLSAKGVFCPDFLLRDVGWTDKIKPAANQKKGPEVIVRA